MNAAAAETVNETVSQAQAQSGGPRPEDIIIYRDVHKWYGGYHALGASQRESARERPW